MSKAAALATVLAIALTACSQGDKDEGLRLERDEDYPTPTVVSFRDSTALRQVTYYRGSLLVEFRDGEGVYVYCGVPERVFEGLREADSAGSYFHDHIADEYDTAVEAEPGSWSCA